MADPIYGAVPVVGKTPPSNNTCAVHSAMADRGHPDIGPVDLVTADQLVDVLATIDETGSAALGDCAAALQPHDRPVAALVELAELGLISFDRSMPCDQHLVVRRGR